MSNLDLIINVWLIVACSMVIVSLVLMLLRSVLSKPTVLPYERQASLFTAAELRFLTALETSVPPDMRILGKPRLADVIAVQRGLDRSDATQAFNRISAKHLDFVLVDRSSGAPELAIELDDASHQRRDRRERDAFVDQALQAAELPLLRVPVTREYDVGVLARSLREALEAAPSSGPQRREPSVGLGVAVQQA